MCWIVLNRITVSGQDNMGLLFLANIYFSSSWQCGRNQSAADFMKAALASIPTLTDSTRYRSRGKAWRIRDNRGSRHHLWSAIEPGWGDSFFTCSGLKALYPLEQGALLLSTQLLFCFIRQVTTFLNLLSNSHGWKPLTGQRTGWGPTSPVYQCLGSPTHDGSASGVAVFPIWTGPALSLLPWRLGKIITAPQWWEEQVRTQVMQILQTSIPLAPKELYIFRTQEGVVPGMRWGGSR